MNTRVIGKIYHVIDTSTGEVIKVGSTIREVSQRFNQGDYRKRYLNYKAVEIKRLESTDLDWYDARDAYCPFLWHLVASEHMEIVRQRTFDKSDLSNKLSPLIQKYHSRFSLSEISSLGGKKGGHTNVISGHLRSISSKGGKSGSLQVKRKNGELLFKNKQGVFAPGIAAKGGRAGGPKSGRLAVESGQLDSLRTSSHQSAAAKSANHNRWHVARNIKKAGCKLCEGQ